MLDLSAELLYRASLATVFGLLFDGADGCIARLTKTQSDLGVQLDSLADVITFGVAPTRGQTLSRLRGAVRGRVQANAVGVGSNCAGGPAPALVLDTCSRHIDLRPRPAAGSAWLG